MVSFFFLKEISNNVCTERRNDVHRYIPLISMCKTEKGRTSSAHTCLCTMVLNRKR